MSYQESILSLSDKEKKKKKDLLDILGELFQSHDFYYRIDSDILQYQRYSNIFSYAKEYINISVTRTKIWLSKITKRKMAAVGKHRLMYHINF